jgi:hypothetical protein
MTRIYLLSIIFLHIKTLTVKTINSLIQDQYNRYTIFHGVNVVYKIAPFYPSF